MHNSNFLCRTRSEDSNVNKRFCIRHERRKKKKKKESTFSETSRAEIISHSGKRLSKRRGKHVNPSSAVLFRQREAQDHHNTTSFVIHYYSNDTWTRTRTHPRVHESPSRPGRVQAQRIRLNLHDPVSNPFLSTSGRCHF